MKADLHLTHADQCRQMGIKVGDTIRGDYRGIDTVILTLLWLGDRVAVWRVRVRYWNMTQWNATYESASWSLGHREWEFCEEPPDE